MKKTQDSHFFQKYRKKIARQNSLQNNEVKQHAPFSETKETQMPVTHAAHAEIVSALFDTNAISSESLSILNNFDTILNDIHPLNSKQQALLRDQIYSLSLALTAERDTRRLGYMNETTQLSSYAYYFMWWNLIRFVRLFANMPASSFSFSDAAVCLDIGSGPLTIPIALWLARPELRSVKLEWYVLDYSQTALAFGEEIFLAIAARTIEAHTNTTPWKIVRIKGPVGTEIRQKVQFITCANVFNEILQHSTSQPGVLAEKYTSVIEAYSDTAKDTTIFIADPGVPRSGQFISLLRNNFIKRGYQILSPCPHHGICPMDGSRGGKWCNYAFSTADAPKRLLKLSETSRLTKDRAVLTYLCVTKKVSDSKIPEKNQEEKKNTPLIVRITSDPIKLPGDRTGYYACSNEGLILVINRTGSLKLSSGLILKIQHHTPLTRKDRKSGASVIEI